MCKADENGDLIHEIMGAMSSLNMYPDPIEGAEGYLSETDAWAKHSMEHLHAAVRIAGRERQQLNTLLCKLDMVLSYYHELDEDMPTEGDYMQWTIDKLSALIQKAREERKGLSS